MSNSQNIKILHVIPSMNPKEGGTVQALKTMISGLPEDKVLNEIVSLDSVKSSFINGSPCVIHAIGNHTGPWKYNKRLASWLLANLAYFDCVIVHGLWSYAGYATRVALKKLARGASGAKLPKLLVMPHGMLDPYFQRAANRKLKAFRNVIFWKLIEEKLVNSADALLFTCDEEMTLASIPFKPYAPKMGFVVGLGLAAPAPYNDSMREAFAKSCPSLNKSPFILFLGRIDEKKGVDMLLKAYSKAIKVKEADSNNIPILGVLPKLVIAGPGLDTIYGRNMQAMVTRDDGLRNMVIFPGMLTGDAKWGAFYQSEAFILPSHQENFGVAVVEALSCGVPVLISNQVNIWREINETGGCYVSTDSVEGTFKLFQFWDKSSYKQKQAMSRNALQAYNKYFALAPAAKKLLKAIKETLKIYPIINELQDEAF